MNMLQSYWIQIDNQINNAVTYAARTAYFGSDLQLALSSNESDSALAKQRISLNLSDQILYGADIIDTLFVYTDQTFISSSQKSLSNEEKSALQSYILQVANPSGKNDLNFESDWHFIKTNNQTGMVHVSKGENHVITGIYVNLDRLLSHFANKEGIASLFLVPNQDIHALQFNHQKDNLIITSYSSAAPISFVEIIPENAILRALPFMQKYMLVISVLVLLMLPFVFYLLRRIVVRPLQNLNKAMKQIQRGDLEYRIPPYPVSNEIAIVNLTFNQMMDDIRNLKISVYEEEIKTQKSQLRNLQMQIQPHFIINSLNMVFNLIEIGDSETAKKLIVHSVDFYRYMVNVDRDLVPLTEEIKHVDTYLQIQLIRYQDKFTYSIKINKIIADMLVPPMLIQNFVENSIKYAINSNRCIHISVEVESFEKDFYPFAKIIVSDTGKGYPEHQLEQLNQGRAIANQKGEHKHIGIRNTVQRLSLLFDRKAAWRFYNQNGAVSELIFPAIFPDQTDDPVQLEEE